VRGRSSAGVIWNIEKIVAADDAAGAVLTCTPDATSTSGYRLITDAYNGAINPYIKWSNAPISINGRTYNTIPYSGSSSRSLFLTNSDSSYRQSGTLGSGSMPPPGKPPVELAQSPCTGVGSIGSSTSTGGVQLDEITCDSAQGVRRLSWREIF
jgi:type IV pilus assembly protein PilY1